MHRGAMRYALALGRGRRLSSALGPLGGRWPPGRLREARTGAGLPWAAAAPQSRALLAALSTDARDARSQKPTDAGESAPLKGERGEVRGLSERSRARSRANGG